MVCGGGGCDDGGVLARNGSWYKDNIWWTFMLAKVHRLRRNNVPGQPVHLFWSIESGYIIDKGKFKRNKDIYIYIMKCAFQVHLAGMPLHETKDSRSSNSWWWSLSTFKETKKIYYKCFLPQLFASSWQQKTLRLDLLRIPGSSPTGHPVKKQTDAEFMSINWLMRSLSQNQTDAKSRSGLHQRWKVWYKNTMLLRCGRWS